jgi:uncharacterized protein (DUF1015 family)
MATLRPYRALRYTTGKDLSAVIAPPYDVLDGDSKAALLARSDRNIVKVDLPFVPPKTLGPQAVYDEAATTLKQWIADGTLAQDARPAFYPYEQTFTVNGKPHKRRGFFALVKLTPFGVDVIPHEKTYAGPIEDRLRLMHATGMQLSPVFGLYYDDGDAIARALFDRVSAPAATGSLDDVSNRLWTEFDAAIEQRVIDLFKSKKVYIADGHHRYTTALHYQTQMIDANGGKDLPPDHPANYCLMVLVNAADPGLLVLPTHRLVKGLIGYSLDAFLKSIEPSFEITRTPLRPEHVDELADTLGGYGANAIGVYDGATKALVVIRPRDSSLMQRLEPDKSDDWRSLDVAVLQRAVFDDVLSPLFAGGQELQRGYTADANAVAPKVDSGEYQIAFVLRSTPVRALEQLGRHGEVMPQKSTYFYPKLATGLTISPLIQ